MKRYLATLLAICILFGCAAVPHAAAQTLTAASNGLVINGNLLTGVRPGTTAGELKGLVTLSQAGAAVSVQAGGSTLGDNGIVATGMTYQAVMDGAVSMTVVVAGDVDSDGACSILDLVKVKRSLAGLENGLTAAQQKACDYRMDNQVNALDLIQMKRYLLKGDTTLKGMWISQFDMDGVLKSGGRQRDKASFTVLFRTMVQKVKDDGFNAVFLQVRPYADSFYPSAYYPMSNYVTGAFGREADYDPFAIMVAQAKALGLQVHAWINPMRGMTTAQMASVPAGYPMKEWYGDASLKSRYLPVVNNRIYLNPAYDQVRRLIAAGAGEIVRNYEVDGVHMDDYFYPTKDAGFDAAAYAEYQAGGGGMSLTDWRRGNLDAMVKGIYDEVKSVNPHVAFGISPAGNMSTVLDDHYANVNRWGREAGYVDYLCPQVYFGLRHQNYDFVKVCKQWNEITVNPAITLYVGMTLGKAQSGYDQYAGSGAYEWRDNKDVIRRCLLTLPALQRCEGVIWFCYQYCYDPVTGTPVPETQQERDNSRDLLKNLTLS